MSDRDIVISYHDALIRQSDYRLLHSNEWINDSLIEFWFEYLQHDVYCQYESQLLCLSPSLSQLIKLTDDLQEICLITEPLQVQTKQVILIPVNNSYSLQSTGGSHWSLLVFVRKNNRFESYDSARNNNMQDATIIARKLSKMLTNMDNADRCKIAWESCHQQDNSYDCGIHLMLNSDAICRKYLLNDDRPITQIVTVDKIGQFRKQLIHIIDSLKN